MTHGMTHEFETHNSVVLLEPLTKDPLRFEAGTTVTVASKNERTCVLVYQMGTVTCTLVVNRKWFDENTKPYKEPEDATIHVNGPSDGVLGTEGIDELATEMGLQEVPKNTVGILLRGRSGKLYSFGSILQKIMSRI